MSVDHKTYGRNRRKRATEPNDVVSTPGYLFDALNDQYAFDVDVCAIASNAKCERYFSPDVDGLSQTWAPLSCFMNPPWSGMNRWVRKAYMAAAHGGLVVGVIPSRTEQGWFHDYVLRDGVELRCRSGVPKSEEFKSPWPAAAMIVVWHRDLPRRRGPFVGAAIDARRRR